jgi:thiol-disulfide isomerase/thioredoxin
MPSASRSRRRIGWALVLIVVLALPALAGNKQPYVDGELKFAFLDLDGRTVRSSDPEFRGKVLLVDLWATWCTPCLGEIPTFIDLQERLGERGLVIVAIAFESEDEEEESRRQRLREFVEHHGINYLVLDGRAPRDSSEALSGLKNVQGFPVEILIDREGDPVDVRNGYKYTKRWARKLERELTELLDAPAPTRSAANGGHIGESVESWRFDTGG